MTYSKSEDPFSSNKGNKYKMRHGVTCKASATNGSRRDAVGVWLFLVVFLKDEYSTGKRRIVHR